MTDTKALKKFKGGKGNEKKNKVYIVCCPRCNHRALDTDYADVEIKCPECRKIYEVKLEKRAV